jgi:peptidoglycan biosynthesis protein MviN/MurJ (putative lipid II flippase)
MRNQLIGVGVLTAIGQLAAFFKVWVTARLFGISAELDGYNLALVAPTLVSGVLSGMVQTGLFPVRARLAAHGKEEQAMRFEQLVLSAMAMLGILLAVGLFLGQDLWLPWLVSSVTPDVRKALTFALPFTLPLIALNSIGDTAGYLLAVRNRYPVAAFATIINALVGSFLLLAWPSGGLLGLAISTVLGLVVQVGICLAALARTGHFFRHPTVGLRSTGSSLLEAAKLSLWILPAMAISSLAGSLPTILAGSFGEGAVSAFGYANRFHQAAVQIFAISIAPILLARFAGLSAVRDFASMRLALAKAGVWSLVIGAVASIMVLFFGASILSSIFIGRFDAIAAVRVTQHWFWLSAGLGFSIFGGVLARFWQASGRSALLTLFALVQCLSLYTFYFFLVPLGEVAVSAALSAASLTTIAFNLVLLPARLQYPDSSANSRVEA